MKLSRRCIMRAGRRTRRVKRVVYLTGASVLAIVAGRSFAQTRAIVHVCDSSVTSTCASNDTATAGGHEITVARRSRRRRQAPPIALIEKNHRLGFTRPSSLSPVARGSAGVAFSISNVTASSEYQMETIDPDVIAGACSMDEDSLGEPLVSYQ